MLDAAYGDGRLAGNTGRVIGTDLEAVKTALLGSASPDWLVTT